jgi:hypothetical protein
MPILPKNRTYYHILPALVADTQKIEQQVRRKFRLCISLSTIFEHNGYVHSMYKNDISTW